MKSSEEIFNFLKDKISEKYDLEVFQFRGEATIINFTCKSCREEEACYLYNILDGDNFLPCNICGEVFVEKIQITTEKKRVYKSSSDEFLLKRKQNKTKTKKKSEVRQKPGPKKKENKVVEKRKRGRQPITEAEKERRKKIKAKKLLQKKERKKEATERRRKKENTFARKMQKSKKRESRRKKTGEVAKKKDWLTEEDRKELREKFLENVIKKSIEKRAELNLKNKKRLIAEKDYTYSETNKPLEDVEPEEMVELVCNKCGKTRNIRKKIIRKSTFKEHRCSEKEEFRYGIQITKSVEKVKTEVDIFIKDILPSLKRPQWALKRINKSSFYYRICKCCGLKIRISFRKLNEEVMERPCLCYKKRRIRERLIRRLKNIKKNKSNEKNFTIDKKILLFGKAAKLSVTCKKCGNNFQKRVESTGDAKSPYNRRNTLICSECFYKWLNKRREENE